MAAQAGFSLTVSQTPEDRFSHDGAHIIAIKYRESFRAAGEDNPSHDPLFMRQKANPQYT